MKENVFEFSFFTLNAVTCIVGMLVMFRSRRSLEPSISYTILAVTALTCGILSGLLGKSIYGEVWIAWGLGLVSSAVTMLTGASTRTLPSGMIGLCVMKSKLVALMFLYVGGVAFSRGVMPFSQMFRITYDNAWGVVVRNRVCRLYLVVDLPSGGSCWGYIGSRCFRDDRIECEVVHLLFVQDDHADWICVVQYSGWASCA